MKKIAILGSTGSIGKQTLEVIAGFPGRFEVYGLAAHRQVDLLAEQVKTYRPKVVVLSGSEDSSEISSKLAGWEGRLLFGAEGMVELAADPEVETLVSAVVGIAGLPPTLAAFKAGKDVALANKESLVSAGELVTSEMKKARGRLLPIDSEHSAIFQALMGQNIEELSSIILTASGGPFRESTLEEMEKVTPQEALTHPTWKMGGKITIDSATLMNKGLEVIEAHWLFGVDYERIKVVVHPQSIVHSMIEMIDGTILAQLGPADMRLPIAFALTYPTRRGNRFSRLDPFSIGALEFYPPDYERFPCLRLAYESGRIGKSMPTVMNAANEEAVNLFFEGRIGFLGIARMIEEVMGEHQKSGLLSPLSLEDILEVDRWARNLCGQLAKGYT